MHAETPTALEEFTGTIQNISDDAKLTQACQKKIKLMWTKQPLII